MADNVVVQSHLISGFRLAVDDMAWAPDKRTASYFSFVWVAYIFQLVLRVSQPGTWSGLRKHVVLRNAAADCNVDWLAAGWVDQ